MGIVKQLRSVIEWRNPSAEVLFEEWAENGDEIKNASTLIVGPGEGCVFVYEGRIEAVYTDEGSVNLRTANIPFWTTIKNVMQNFESSHKTCFYFFRKAQLVNRKWGTRSTIKYADPLYKFPVGLICFGNASYRITRPDFFFREIVGSENPYYTAQLQDIIVSRITQPVSDYLANASFSYLEVDKNRELIANAVKEKSSAIFEALGFELTDFRIEGTGFDEDTKSRVEKIAGVQADDYAAKSAGLTYTELQQLEAMKAAAKNESGAAGAAMQMAAGVNLAGMMQQPLIKPDKDVAERLKQLKNLYESGLISEEEYGNKKAELLKDL